MVAPSYGPERLRALRGLTAALISKKAGARVAQMATNRRGAMLHEDVTMPVAQILAHS